MIRCLRIPLNRPNKHNPFQHFDDMVGIYQTQNPDFAGILNNQP
jgi:hypothetical protein